MTVDHIAVGDDAAWIMSSVIRHVYDERYQPRDSACCMVDYNVAKPPHYTFMFGETRMTLDCFRTEKDVTYVFKGEDWLLNVSATEQKVMWLHGNSEAMKLALLAMRLWEPSS